MVYASEDSTTQDFPKLPTEIMDNIIWEASRTLDARSVSSIALTSHFFHFKANKIRFSALDPAGNASIPATTHTVTRVGKLANIIRDGMEISSLPGVCTFASSFTLRMLGFRTEIAPVLEDGSLTIIINNLFRQSHVGNAGCLLAASIRSFSLHVNQKTVNGRTDEYSGLDWDLLNNDFRKALQDLILYSQLNELHLNEMRSLPYDILLGSMVRALHLREVSLNLSNRLNRTSVQHESPRARPIPLESLGLDETISSADLALLVHPNGDINGSTGLTLNHLTSFTIHLTTASVMNDLNLILRNTPVLVFMSAVWISYSKPRYPPLDISLINLNTRL